MAAPARPLLEGLTRFAAGFDRAAHWAALSRSERSRRRSQAESLGPRERAEALRNLRDRYKRPELLATPELFFPAPRAPLAKETAVRAFGRAGEVVDLKWDSGYALFAEDVAERYLRHEANRTVVARLVRHRDRPRPAVVLVHGYLGGNFALEERAWPLGWLFEAGLDVALAVLPMHGPRASGGRPRFPSSDPRVTNEGFRQAVHDLRGLVCHLRARGAPAVGMMGMSLGGYTTALVATVEPDLAFAVPFIPLASIADFAREGGRYVGTVSQQAEQHRLLEEVHAVVSPLSRPPLVPPAGRLVVAGEADRITPADHARRIAEHFEAPLETFPGGHLLQFGRARGFRAVGRMLGGLGLLEPRSRGR